MCLVILYFYYFDLYFSTKYTKKQNTIIIQNPERERFTKNKNKF